MTETHGDAGAVDDSPLGVCVLIHGINGSPEDMDELSAALDAQGFEVRNLLLPGHGTSVRDFARHGWDDWIRAVERATDDALEQGRPVFVVGHSLGAALALAVAAERPRLAGVAPLCPPVRLYAPLVAAVAAARHVAPYLPAWREDIRDRKGARLRYRRNVYHWTSTAALHTLMSALPRLRRRLPAITVPALVVAARHDHVVPARDGREAYELLGSERKELVILRHSYHAVTKDVERSLVTERVIAFCQSEAQRWRS
ncbi:MAG TPA: alpha/beta fold hydrolase [Ktedonobacterales bacterium]|nr:alpha/beta fold hydrolase [Ktedonobacterales bacterium]